MSYRRNALKAGHSPASLLHNAHFPNPFAVYYYESQYVVGAALMQKTEKEDEVPIPHAYVEEV